jgi:ankyrin repeat protein
MFCCVPKEQFEMEKITDRQAALLREAEKGNFEAFLKEAQPYEAWRILSGQKYAPIHHLAIRGKTEFLERLVLIGADVNEAAAGNGRTALHIAAERKDGVLVQALLGHGADPRIRDHAGKLPSDLCAVADIRQLLDSRVAQLDEEDRLRALHIPSLELIRLLLVSGLSSSF